MKIAVCQASMYWTIEENVENIIQWIRKAKKEEADLAVFMECAITGYHRKMPQTVSSKSLEIAHQKIKTAAMENQIAVIVGTPFIKADSLQSIFNSAIYFNPNSKGYKITSKIGLTETELLFFTKGQKREVFKIGDLNIGIVFCREIQDAKELIEDYHNTNLNLLLWPSYIKWDSELELGEIDYLEAGCTLSQKLNVPILNINAANSLNDLSLRGLGASVFVRNGEIVFTLAEDEEELKVVELH
ncbi:MAG: carbon-nitrogen hydrolase family protein [Chitinophagales bacterium]